MADTKISNLTSETTPVAADLLVIVDTAGSETKQITLTNFYGTPEPIGATTPNTGSFTTLSTSSDFTLGGDLDVSGQATNISLIDANASALDIKEGANSYLTFVTSDGSEKITLGKKLEAGSIEIEGSAFDINGGTVDAITSLTVANNVDIGAYELRAATFQSDIVTGTAPFIVASTTVVSNLNADQVDGFDLDQNVSTTGTPQFTTVTVDNSGIHILDTDASHDLILTVGSDLSADRILTFTTGDVARTITLSGNPTLADWFDQAVKQASSPTFAGLISSAHLEGTTGNGQLELRGDSGAANDVVLYDTGILDIEAQSAFKATRATAQGIADTWEKIEFNTEVYDKQSEYDPTTNYRFTAGKAGRYLIHAAIAFASIGDGVRMGISIYLNGTINTLEFGQSGLGGQAYSVSVTDILDLSANDYIEIFGQQGLGGDINIVTHSAYNYFAISKIA